MPVCLPQSIPLSRILAKTLLMAEFAVFISSNTAEVLSSEEGISVWVKLSQLPSIIIIAL
jgi:hypothetical protein